VVERVVCSRYQSGDANPKIKEGNVPIARVVTFEGVTTDRIEELRKEIEGGEQPEGLNASEMLVLHDSGSSDAMAIVFFENEDDYQRGHEILDAMPAPETPGQRTSVHRYDVAIRMTS
jgi:hypothetical protein